MERVIIAYNMDSKKVHIIPTHYISYGRRDILLEIISSYVFIFHQITDVLEELPAYLNKNHANNVEYILACYRSQIDGFDTSVVT